MKRILMAGLFGMAALQANATDVPPAMVDYAMEQAQTWVADPMVIAAIKAQNARNGGLSEAEIIDLDNQWRAELNAGNRPMIDTVMANELSAHLKKHADASGGAITEVFVMDQVGLNVGQSALTSDYWQGDEAKFTETYPKGAGSVHVSEIELDESTQTYQAQVSMPVVDPADGSVVGAVTFGINVAGFL